MIQSVVSGGPTLAPSLTPGAPGPLGSGQPGTLEGGLGEPHQTEDGAPSLAPWGAGGQDDCAGGQRVGDGNPAEGSQRGRDACGPSESGTGQAKGAPHEAGGVGGGGGHEEGEGWEGAWGGGRAQGTWRAGWRGMGWRGSPGGTEQDGNDCHASDAPLGGAFLGPGEAWGRAAGDA